MCELLIFNTQKRYEKQKNFGNFSATFWQLLDTFIGNFFGIHRPLVAKPIKEPNNLFLTYKKGLFLLLNVESIPPTSFEIRVRP